MQQGSLRREQRSTGEVWVLRYKARRDSDGKRVERSIVVGDAETLPTLQEARRYVETHGLLTKVQAGERPTRRDGITIGELALIFVTEVLDGDEESQLSPLSHTTRERYRRALTKFILPRWRTQIAAEIDPSELEAWWLHLRKQGYANQSLHKLKVCLLSLFRHGIKRRLLPFKSQAESPIRLARCPQRSGYRSMTITPGQAKEVWQRLREPARTIALLTAATGGRISECLGLRWGDVDFEQGSIHIQRSWTGGRVGHVKTEASERYVAMSPVLVSFLQRWREETPYAGDEDWCFASFKMKGRQPLYSGELVANHLRPAAVAAKVIAPDSKVRFGFHVLRHSLSTWLVGQGASSVVVRDTLGHSNISTTLGLYTHTSMQERRAAQAAFLGEFFGGNPEAGTGVPENAGGEKRVEN